MAYTGLRIHPAIGIARVGNSEEYYLGPETMAGMDVPDPRDPSKVKNIKGGLPIYPGTEDQTILSTDLRDDSGRLKRQAARFRIYQYHYDDAAGAETYPAGQGSEVLIGATVDGKLVKDIVWTVHLANKKANSWDGGDGADAFKDGRTPPLRNPTFGALDQPERLKALVIDAGPRAVLASQNATVRFDAATEPSYGLMSSGAIAGVPAYPVSFPAGGGGEGAITSLGAIATEAPGRLLVLGGYGKAAGFDKDGNYSATAALDGNVNNDYWFDDIADGPVTAILLFEDGSTRAVEGGAWVIASDPSYAPQNANVVSLWDDLYCTWLEQMALQPAVYSGGQYLSAYRPDFGAHVQPVLRAAALQKWTTFLPVNAIRKHDWLGALKADGLDGFMIMNYIRNPNKPDQAQNGKLMPLSLGDAGKSLLSLTTAQYFFMSQWSRDRYVADAPQALGPGEQLDRTILFNCLGGRYSPGIEMSFIVRDPQLYQRNWARHDAGGPFRINMQALDYGTAVKDKAFLGIGYVPLRGGAVQPGDLSKFMALPWHTDYNSCATHLPDPNPRGELTEANIDEATSAVHNPDGSVTPRRDGRNTLLYSSWPAQRPVAVYTYDDVVASNSAAVARAEDLQLPTPRFSVRGAGTASDATPVRPDDQPIERPAMQVGRYQDRRQFVQNWYRVGVVMQGAAIVQTTRRSLPLDDCYLEVESGFKQDESNLAEYWRNTVIDQVYRPNPDPKPRE